MERIVDREAAGGRLGPQRTAGAAGQLTARGRAAADDVRDIVERVLEHVVEHERRALRRAEPFEQRVHRHDDVVDQRDLARRVDRVRVERVVARAERVGRAPASRAEPIEAEPAGDDDQPAFRIVDARDARAAEADERFLHDVFGVGDVGQDAERDVEHARPVRVPHRRENRIVGAHDFFRMPSCQINFTIDGFALGVAIAIVACTYVSSSAWRNRQSARSIRAVNRYPMWSIATL